MATKLPIRGTIHDKYPDSWDVVHNGEIIGRDNDPAIRAAILAAAQAQTPQPPASPPKSEAKS